MTARELTRTNDRFRLARATYVVSIERRGETLTRRLAFGAHACRLALRQAARDASGLADLTLASGLSGVGVCALERLCEASYRVETPWTPPGGYVVCARLA